MFEKLVLSGGGARGLAIMGSLHYFHEHEMLHNITEYWGTSIGSVLCVLLALGKTPLEIFTIFLKDYGHISNPNTNLIRESLSLCNIEAFGEKMRGFIGNDYTFREIKLLYGKSVNILVANTNTLKCEVFSDHTTPDMSVVEALETSCDLPFMFTRKNLNGCVYVDGGIVNNYAIDLADDWETPTLGICVFGEENEIKYLDSHIGWIYRLLLMPMLELHRYKIKECSNKVKNIILDIKSIGMLELAPERKVKMEAFCEGYEQTMKHFS